MTADIELILFDLDGTLTDSKPGIVACIRYALEKLGTDIGPDIDLEPYIGPPLGDTFASLCPGIDVELAGFLEGHTLAFPRQARSKPSWLELQDGNVCIGVKKLTVPRIIRYQ